MLEYFSYKKYKKHKANKEAEEAKTEAQKHSEARSGKQKASDVEQRAEDHGLGDDTPSGEPPVLDLDDESFLESILSDDGPPPPLPPRRVVTPVIDSDTESDVGSRLADDLKGKKKAKDHVKKEDKKANRLSSFFKKPKKNEESLEPEDTVPPEEAEREKKDLGRVLDRLNLYTKNNKVISLSDESSEMLRKFTNVFKDLVNGVPTAYGDLTHLIDDRNEIISKSFDKLPKSLQKLVTQLPEKITGSLAPEILEKAAESQGIALAAEGGTKAAAAQLFSPKNVMELVTTPGAVAGMLRAIVSALKTRWPAFIGVNVLWSVALFLLMLVLWYCHKRGREVRLEREKSEADGAPIEAGDRIEELPDDPQLPAPREGSTTVLEASPSEQGPDMPDLPRPPIGDDAPNRSAP